MLSGWATVVGGTTTVQAGPDTDHRPGARDDHDERRAQADTVVPVVSEVVTNALRHGGGAYTLRLIAHPSCIEVAVEEPGWHMINDLALTTVVTPGSNGGKRRTVLSSPGSAPPARLRQLPAAIRGFVWRFHRRGSDQLCLGSRRPRRRASRSRAGSRRPPAA
ncbi:hypothetical protein Slala05_83110 [Streptomyces lavendulae subsp. lavendulae]|nr:hypothetical protein Slala05_83110 [Streptomyces lavendulae subsp. lavendulae]